MPSHTNNRIDALPIGTKLHGYVVERALGHGGFGIVYLARHLELGGRVAIKEYMPSALAIRRETSVLPTSAVSAEHYKEGLRRFLAEARQLVRFENHPNVVSCRDFFRENGTAYLVMEYVDGLTLADLLQRREQQGRPFDEAELMAIATPLLEGLQTVHAAGVLHRDVKPANVIVRRSDERPVLIDFGAAKHFIAEHSSSMAPYTEGYAANEQISQGGQLGPWTDLYALGGVLWRIVAGGSPPWADPRWSGLNWRPPNPLRVELRMRAVGRGQADPLPSAREVGAGRFSTRTLDAIDRCLEVWEEDRVQDCSKLLELLRRDGKWVASSPVVTALGDTQKKPAYGQTAKDRTIHNQGDRANRSSATYSSASAEIAEDNHLEEDREAAPIQALRPLPQINSRKQSGRSAQSINHISRFLIKSFSGLIAALLYLGGIEIKRETVEEAFVIGILFQLLSVVLFYVVFCRWSRTKIRSPNDFEKHRIPLACCWFFVGSVTLIGVFYLLAISYQSELVLRTIISSYLGDYPGFDLVAFGTISIAAATGVLYRSRWSIKAVVVLSFLVSTSVFGLLIAWYTWWVTSLDILKFHRRLNTF